MEITSDRLQKALSLLGELVVYYGPGLLIGYISRRDQIFFKLHAAVDRDGGRHLQDLMDLQPTAEELRDAAQWAQTQDPSEGFLYNLRVLMKEIAHDGSNPQR